MHVCMYVCLQAMGLGPKDVLDLVITNALIVDYSGVYKADIGVKGCNISGIGKAGEKWEVM